MWNFIKTAFLISSTDSEWMKQQALQNVTNAYKACESDMNEFDSQNAFLDESKSSSLLPPFFLTMSFSVAVIVHIH